LWENRRIEEKAGYLPNLSDSNLFGSEVFTAAKKDFFQALVDARNSVKDKIPIRLEDKAKLLEPLALAGKLMNESDLEGWLALKRRHLFSWKDYSQAWYRQKAVINENSGNADLIFSASVNVCFAFYYFNGLFKEEDFESFMLHKPYDYTRPHGWYKHKGYISMGEALAAMINFTDRKGVVSDAEKTLRLFAKQYPDSITEKPTRFSDLLIPYQLYSRSFDEAHSPEAIRPHSVEICIYYVQQNGLPLENIYEEKARINHPRNMNSYHYYGASFKYFDTFDLMRFLTVWKLFLNLFGRTVDPCQWKDDQFAQHCRNFFKFTRFSGAAGAGGAGGESPEAEVPTNKFFWWGIQTKDHHASYREVLKESLSFFGEILNGVALSLVLEAQVIALFEHRRRNPKLDDLQKALCTRIFAKHREVREWLDKQYANRKHVALTVTKPCWTCAHEDTFHLIPALPNSLEAYEFERYYVGTQSSPKCNETFIFKSTIKSLLKNLKEADLTQISTSSMNEINVKYALFGMQAITSKRSFERSQHQEIKKLSYRIRKMLGLKTKNSEKEEEAEEERQKEKEPPIRDWEDIQKMFQTKDQSDTNFLDLAANAVDALLYIYVDD